MGWEVRAGSRYYYRKERDPQTGRVRSVYCGGGEKGEAAEREDERRRCATTQVMTNDAQNLTKPDINGAQNLTNNIQAGLEKVSSHARTILEEPGISESKIPAIPERRKPTFAEFFALEQPPKT